jgi:PKHD-type hydroxylase
MKINYNTKNADIAQLGQARLFLNLIMILTIDNILSDSELGLVNNLIGKAQFINGKTTAGWHAKLVKNNTQVEAGTDEYKKLYEIVKKALFRNTIFQSAVRPKIIHSLLFSRYEQGMSYGRHVDNGLMGGNNFFRSDVSFTIFLSEPSSYGGGELVIEQTDSDRSFKLGLNSAVVYSSSTLHRVKTVTEGVRLVGVGWVQSLVRDSYEREILFDLDTARRSIFSQQGKTTEFDLISKSYANLLRKWME